MNGQPIPLKKLLITPPNEWPADSFEETFNHATKCDMPSVFTDVVDDANDTWNHKNYG